MRRTLISAAVTTLVVMFAGTACAAPVFPRGDMQVSTQLPRTVRPMHYDVSIAPNMAASTFTGKVKISIDVLTPTSSITLNAANLAFQHASLNVPHGKGMAIAATTSIDADAQTATFRFKRPVTKGRYELALDYTGVIGDQAAGLFALDYDTSTGKKRALYTQFENSDARRMIPSWDEPNYKATFALRVTVPSDEMAVSNMPIAKKTRLPDGRNLIEFAPSPKMSTYLLFFALGEFDRATTNEGKTELGVVTRKGVLSQAAFALDASKAILKEYNDYFGYAYPLPKLDNIAGPGRSQFFGAMENWGAIFTFERDMLLDPAISTLGDKQEIFATAAHEMAHQWFGDLVTMRWWDDLWLNEGFASWMESRTTAHLHPEWNTAMQAVGGAQHAMGADSVATTHPIVQHIETVEQASQAFDTITYLKGEAVIRMLENYVGADAWRQGVRAYMQAHAHGNTTSDDLWAQMDKAAGEPVSAIAHDFTLQPGVPMIRVDKVVCEAGQSTVTLTQTEFSKDQPNKTPLHWRVPVNLQATGSPQTVRALVSGNATITLPGCGAVLVNAGQNGYFHTLYTPQTFPEIGKAFSQLPSIDQLGLLADSWALGWAGQQPISNYLDLVKATSVTTDPHVWEQVVDAFTSLHQSYQGDKERQKAFDAFAIDRLAPVLARINWTAQADEPSAIVNLREQLIAALANLGDDNVISEARRRYAAQASDPAAMPIALRRVITAVIAQHADDATWEKLHTLAKSDKSPMVKDQLYSLLAASEDDTLATRALELALTDEPGATNSAEMIEVVAQQHPDLAFDFALAHIERVNHLVDNSSRSLYFPLLARQSADPLMVNKLDAYAKAHLSPSARHEVDNAIANINVRARLRAERLPEVDHWLSVSRG